MDKNFKNIAEAYSRLSKPEIYKIWIDQLNSLKWKRTYSSNNKIYEKVFGTGTYTLELKDISTDGKEIEINLFYFEETDKIDPDTKKNALLSSSKNVIVNAEPTIGYQFIAKIMEEMKKNAKLPMGM